MINVSEYESSVNKKPVVLFGDNITSFGVIRGLRDLKVDIYVVSENGKGVGAFSRYVKDVIVLSSTQSDYIDQIVSWIKTNFKEKPVLMVAGNDDALVFLSKQHERLCEYAIPTFPEWSVVNQVINKELINDVANKLCVPTIDTWRFDNVKSLEVYLESLKGESSFPVFLKSAYSRKFSQKYGTKGVVCYSKKEVIRAYEKYDGFFGALLLQDFLPGDIDQISVVLLVLNKDGKVVSVAANEKIRSAVRYGSTSLSSSSWHQQMVESAVLLAEAIGYVGFVGVQFKYDPRCNEFKFLEINGRFSVSVSLAQRCGQNMAELVYKEFVGPTQPRLSNFIQNYPDNILLWRPLDDMLLLKQSRFYSKPLFFLRSLVGSGYIVEPFSLRDPFPVIVSVWNVLVNGVRKVIRKRF